jgi:hypothetical protein
MRRAPGTPAEKLALLRGINETSLPHLVADVLYFCRNHRNVLVVDGPGDGRRDVSSTTPDGDKHLAQCKFHIDVTAAVPGVIMQPEPPRTSPYAICMSVGSGLHGLLSSAARRHRGTVNSATVTSSSDLTCRGV